jgi:hypothetical protein
MLLISKIGQTIPSHNLIELCLCLALDIRIDDHGKKEGDDGSDGGVGTTKIYNCSKVLDELGCLGTSIIRLAEHAMQH